MQMHEPISHHELVQGSQEWHDARCGLLTASMVKSIVTAKTLKYAANEKTRAHVYEIAAQRVTNYVEPSPTTFAMARGHTDEVYARDMYNDTKSAEAVETGFITREIEGATIGYSPDGLVGDVGLIEIKSRAQKHQFKTIMGNEVPFDYMLQIQTGLLVSGRKWLDFISYSGGMALFVKRVHPVPSIQEAIVAAAVGFEKSVSDAVAVYRSNAKGLAIAERHEEATDEDWQ
jgi:predicted phage-related endonuclease